MADNTVINVGSGGDSIRDKDRTGVKTQIVGLDINPAGSEVLATGDSTNGLDVDVTRVSGTVAVSGPVTDTQLRASAVPVSLASAPTTAVTGPLTDTQLRATPVPVSGTVTANVGSGTQPVSGTVGITEQADGSATGTLIALNGTVSLAVPAGSTTWTARLGGTFAAASVVTFEGSIDGGTTWDLVPMAGRFSISVSPSSTVTGQLVTTFGFNTWTGAAINLTNVRVRLSTFTAADSVSVILKAGTASGVVFPTQYFVTQGVTANTGAAAGNPVLTAGWDGTSVRTVDLRAKGTQSSFAVGTQDLKDSGRVARVLRMDIPILTTATDALMSLTEYKEGTGAVVATTTPAVVTAAKRLRVQAITCTYVATATAGTVKFTLRVNSAGVVAIGSPAVVTHVVGAGTPATAGSSQTESIPIPDGLEFAAGAGIGMSMVGLGVTQAAAVAGYGKCTIYGYEY